jgi:cholestenol delta-isomerase
MSNQVMPARDRAIIGFLVLFLLTSVLEAYWLLHHNEMEQRHDFLARLLAIYWPMDHTYRIPGYGADKAFTLALERVNTLVSQWLNLFLIFAIVKRKPWRHPLQVVLSTYTAYGTFLYFYVAHITGYRIFSNHESSTYLLFYLINAPWLAFCGYMVCDSCVAITRAFRVRAPAS